MTSIPSFRPPTRRDGSAFSKRQRFRRSLAITMSVSLAVLVISSLLTASLIGHNAEKLMTHQMDSTISALAKNSTNVFLVNEADIARTTATALLSLPSVRAVTFIRSDQTVLYASATAVQYNNFDEVRKRLANRTSPYWVDQSTMYHVAPVQLKPTSSPFETVASVQSPAANPIGFLYTVVDLTTVQKAKSYVLIVHVLVLVSGAAILVWWFRRRVRLMETAVDLMTEQLREAYESALTADRHKDQFLATVSHELRQPLTSILGFTELAQKELRFLSKAGRVFENMETVRKTADQMLIVINQLLDYAKLAAGKEQVACHHVDVKEIVDRAVALIRPALNIRGLTFHCDTNLPVTVWTDPEKLFHILSNLLSNASKFTESGHIYLNAIAEDNHLTVVIEDTGIGIAEEHLSMIFEPFRQIDMSDTRSYRGTGMGLAITRSYCEMLGGTISVNSKLGVGSKFVVALPLQAT